MELQNLRIWWGNLFFEKDPVELRKEEVLAKSSVKLDKDLIARVKKCSELAGYTSPEEFIEHIVEKELARLEGAESDDAILKKLKGLGYLE